MPRGFTDRHPYRFLALLEGGVILVYLLAGTVAHFARSSTTPGSVTGRARNASDPRP